MADPLSVLRQYNINKKQIIEKNNQIIFDEYSWPKCVKTNYLIWGSGKDSTPKEYYTLECVLFLLKNVQLSHPVYVKQAAAENIPVVRRPDRKELLAYLNGETSTSNGIDKGVPIEIPATVKHSIEEENLQEAVKKPKLEEGELQRAKEQFAARLDAPKEFPVITEHVKSLSDAMSAEMIAAIKAKRLAKKRAILKENDDVQPNDTSKQHILDHEVNVTLDIIGRERQWSFRSTILQNTGKNFAQTLLPVLKSIKARENATQHKHEQHVQTPRATPVSSWIHSIAYNRYDQERFHSKEETEGFKIHTLGTYHGMTLKSVTEGNLPKRPSTPVIQPEKPLLAVCPLHQPTKRVSKTSIIIIPAVTTSLITMYNVKDLLEDLNISA